jgi:hypothetical protein
MVRDWYLIAAIIMIAACFTFIIALCFHSARAIAAHESGHTLFLWMSPASGGIESARAGVFNGTVMFIPVVCRPIGTERLLNIMGDLSGYAGEAVLLGYCDPGRDDSDLKKAAASAEEYMRRHPDLRGRLAETAAEAPVGTWRAKKRFASIASPEAADLLMVMLMACVRLLEKNRPRLEAVNRELSRRRRLTSEQIASVLGERPSRDEFWRQIRQELP